MLNDFLLQVENQTYNLSTNTKSFTIDLMNSFDSFLQAELGHRTP